MQTVPCNAADGDQPARAGHALGDRAVRAEAALAQHDRVDMRVAHRPVDDVHEDAVEPSRGRGDLPVRRVRAEEDRAAAGGDDAREDLAADELGALGGEKAQVRELRPRAPEIVPDLADDAPPRGVVEPGHEAPQVRVGDARGAEEGPDRPRDRAAERGGRVRPQRAQHHEEQAHQPSDRQVAGAARERSPRLVRHRAASR